MSKVSESSATSKSTRPSRLAYVPLVVFLVLAALFLLRLYAGDASRLPSALIGKPVPTFKLPAVGGLESTEGFSDAELRSGEVTLVNVFASWCVPCHQEHAFLMQLAGQGVRIFGLAYKDDPANITKFLSGSGNPYTRVGADRSGRVAIDWGVYGVPETFIVRGDGTIAYKLVGPMDEASFTAIVVPQIAAAMQL
jgi:cytochrome c biogenesis protein CcmG/thiol:disulfide interchange protein DsbE